MTDMPIASALQASDGLRKSSTARSVVGELIHGRARGRQQHDVARLCSSGSGANGMFHGLSLPGWYGDQRHIWCVSSGRLSQ